MFHQVDVDVDAYEREKLVRVPDAELQQKLKQTVWIHCCFYGAVESGYFKAVLERKNAQGDWIVSTDLPILMRCDNPKLNHKEGNRYRHTVQWGSILVNAAQPSDAEGKQ